MSDLSTPQTIGGVDRERAVGRGPTEHLRDELDLTYGAIKSGHKFTPSLEWIEHICTLAKASASTIEHQLSVIGEYEAALKRARNEFQTMGECDDLVEMIDKTLSHSSADNACEHDWRLMGDNEAYPAMSGKVCRKCNIYSLNWGLGKPAHSIIGDKS